MSEPPLFSVIIPTFNRKESLADCLRSLGRQTIAPGRFEIIVVDDGSTDGTGEMVRAWNGGGSVHYVRQNQLGPGAARNLGANDAAGRILAFTEDDVRIDEHWLERAERHFADETVSAAEGKTLLGEAAGELRLLETGRQLGFVPCNFFVRAEEFRALGGYSSDYFDPARGLYFREDADFGFRLLEKGKRVIFAEDLLVTHPALYRSGREYLRHARRYYFDALLFRKHPRLYRAMIEVKTIGGVTLRRPFHTFCLAYLAGVIAIGVGALVASPLLLGGGLLLGAASLGAIWYRYERRSPRLASLPALLALPFVYAGALMRGCLRFRSFGALW